MEDVKRTVGEAGASAVEGPKTAAAEAIKAAKRVARSRAFKNAAAGAGAGAVFAVPIPFVGPIAGAICGAGVGLFFGDQLRVRIFAQDLTPKDLHAELLKLAELREKGILSEEEFVACKRKLLDALG